jgi:hypothetical protein
VTLTFSGRCAPLYTINAALVSPRRVRLLGAMIFITLTWIHLRERLLTFQVIAADLTDDCGSHQDGICDIKGANRMIWILL